MSRKLTLDDIADVRAYERERADFRSQVIDLKRRRRVHVGTIITFLFENRDTIRFQIQEMARVEKLTTDAEIQIELDIYNPMIPDAGQVCATMFLELTTDDQVREWLPKLANVERSVLLVLSDGSRIRGTIDEQHEQGLTREAVTAAVHYLRWDLTAEQVDAFAAGDVVLEIDHPAYLEAVALGSATHDELLHDLLG
ncbi:uncharacterized protein DUF3501 [Ilumatobacter fluminis]|uniref:Uncharacterized protein DUF3501 n=1 Tax=Ilumatobacter fluminis TaxID=467091 RepID=A0A4R7HY05_9ACTN|nr:DUF3501 family protein [Ilumatobacter fluminis]TDT15971.1 uncharacterized protein DUF3501 [Ilumatobacter fluminis]